MYSVPRTSRAVEQCCRYAGCFAVALVLCGLTPADLEAQADAPSLRLTEGFRSYPIGASARVLIDESRALDFAAVQKLDPGRFAVLERDTPSFGFSRSAFWLRFEVDNPRASTAHWLLEVGYPPLDFLDLYAPVEGGAIEHSAAGDQRPFSARDVKYRNTTFSVNTPPGRHAYFLRVETTGPVTVPLTAWSQLAFIDSINTSYPQLWMFYGWMLVMGLYNLFLFVAVRDRAYLYYVLYIASFTMFEAAFNGLAFQYLWPDALWWTNRCNSLLIALSCATGLQFVRSLVDLRTSMPRVDRVAFLMQCVAFATAALSFAAPNWLMVRLAVVVALAFIGFGLPVLCWLAFRGHRQARFVMAGWTLFLIGAGLYLMTSVGMLAVTPLTEWTIQIGAAAEVLLLSIGLADRINRMRRDLGALNTQLEHNVVELTHALEQAEEAHKAKSAFLASVSHELRTPLNAIINIPEGILESFRSVERVECSQCESRFELETGEELSPDATCPECGGHNMRMITTRVFDGDPTTTATHLEHVHRAGAHLLEVVTDILDASKLEAGRMRLRVETLELGELLAEALGPMYELGKAQGVALEWPTLSEPVWVEADRVKLKQIVLNLVGNAIKFSDGRGVVRVSVHVEADDYRIGVHDQGIGIREEDRQRIFMGFDQGSSGDVRRFGGTGLGLSITRQLVELHGGELWLHSQLGKGSDFYVKLPRVLAHAEVAQGAVSRPNLDAGARVAS